MLSREEVLRIAELAKIEIQEGDVASYQKDLTAILDFIGTLAALPERSSQDHRQMMGLEGALREDEERSGDRVPHGQTLIDSAPENKDGFVLTPRILKDHGDE